PPPTSLPSHDPGQVCFIEVQPSLGHDKPPIAALFGKGRRIAEIEWPDDGPRWIGLKHQLKHVERSRAAEFRADVCQHLKYEDGIDASPFTNVPAISCR